LKSQVSAALAKNAAGDKSNADNPFIGLASLLVSAVSDKLIDAVVTPDGLTAVMKGNRPGGASVKGKNEEPFAETSSDFIDMDHFRVKVAKRGGSPTSLVFERRGIIAWKLTRITVPADVFADKPNPIATPAPTAAVPPTAGPVLSLPVNQTHPFKNGEDWAQIIPATSAPPDIDDCDRPVLASQSMSLDGGYLYQEVCRWVTSNDIVQVRLSDGRRKDVTDGNMLRIIRNGPYRGMLLVEKHKYTSGADMHAYDATFVVRPDGKEMLEVPGSRDADQAVVNFWLQKQGWTAN
jgi:hypothetical protein